MGNVIGAILLWVIAAFFVALPYYAAFASDSFATVMACGLSATFLIMVIFFRVKKIDDKTKKTSKLDVIICIIALVPFFFFGKALKMSTHGIGELTQKRMQTIKSLQPVFVRYNSENGHFPQSLEQLVPKYLAVIPTELINDGSKDGYKRIYYEVMAGEPKFFFKTVRGPDASATINAATGEYWHDM